MGWLRYFKGHSEKMLVSRIHFPIMVRRCVADFGVKMANKNFPSKWLKGEIKRISKGEHVVATTQSSGGPIFACGHKGPSGTPLQPVHASEG